jgi:hypothetical protein
VIPPVTSVPEAFKTIVLLTETLATSPIAIELTPILFPPELLPIAMDPAP